MRSVYCLLLFSILLPVSSCKKEAGQGGTSNIKGKVYAHYYDKNFYMLKSSSYAPDVDVYIIYGNESTYGDHQKTSYDGSYEFKYLRNGSYKVYTYTQDTTGQHNLTLNIYAPLLPVVKTADISKKRQVIELSDMNVNLK